MRKRDDKYWHTAPFTLYDPRPKPLPWYKSVPWWIWPISVVAIGTAIGAALVMFRSF